MIITTYRVSCDADGCEFVSREFSTAMALDLYLMNNEDADGKWLVTRRRRICRGCIIDRACRIFGHQVVRQPGALGGQTWCVRCHRFQAATS